jgi:hypothetical protein
MLRILQCFFFFAGLIVLALVAKFYLSNPSEVINLEHAGVFRLVGAVGIAIGSYRLGVSILKDLRGKSVDDLNVQKDRVPADHGNFSKRHPFLIAFTRHPVASVSVVVVLFLIPILIELLSQEFSWRNALFGEFLSGVIFSFSWIKAGRRMR